MARHRTSSRCDAAAYRVFQARAQSSHVDAVASASADSLAYALHESFKFKLDRAPSQIECLCLTVTGFIKHPFALKEL